MGKFLEAITPEIADFIAAQHLFFTATAPLEKEGHINLSPKGMDSFRVLGPQKVGYMDVISSGNETSAHTRQNGRITFMFCSFAEKAKIVRLYGKGYAVTRLHPEWPALSEHFTLLPSTRQIIVAHIHLVQTSCGFGVPQYAFLGHRGLHEQWAQQKGPVGLHAYMEKNNLQSIDGLPTDIGAEWPITPPA
ncbi:MAG TPA: pyridoxamine 5'-phosphate oxidase family protein [Phnomibacter sp.]|nr:pyridoxamine 5'-phosphate oxidase family protein [Phnomibacter sp.]